MRDPGHARGPSSVTAPLSKPAQRTGKAATRTVLALTLIAGVAAAQSPPGSSVGMEGIWVRSSGAGERASGPRPTLELRRDGTCRRTVVERTGPLEIECQWAFDAAANRLSIFGYAAPPRTAPAVPAGRPVVIDVRWCGGHEVALTGGDLSGEWHRMIRGIRTRVTYCS